ncbi:MAG: hypothetical protein KJ795_09055 [Gammaproteobacteria bacterium]|nr:hypothetical protein [Gammaproteobacteria bacterium]MBU1775300.1 hypothetical protein [Gammaproteobacteria bacterium]MBU1970138.1 hypothetical protein [Gammaproteobacteria bacterium]
MIRRTNIRRPLAVLTMLLGAVLLFAASETASGLTLLVLGVLVEAAGIAAAHRK